MYKILKSGYHESTWSKFMNEAPVRAASCVYFYNVELGPPLIYNVLAIHTNLKLGIDVKNIYNMSLYIVYRYVSNIDVL